MGRPKTQSPPPAPLPPPSDLRDVDTELKALGYTEEKGMPPRRTGDTTFTRMFDTVGNQNEARIKDLLNYRTKFLDSEDKIRRESPRGRAANILSAPKADLSSPTLASRTLLG